MILRPYQEEAYTCTLEKFKTVDTALCVLATGLGKTVYAAHLINHFRQFGRILMLAHRAELIYQADNHIQEICDVESNIEMGSEWATSFKEFKADVVISTVQTQIAGAEGGRMTRFDPNEFSLLIIDEAHHAPAVTYKRIIEYYKQNPNLKILGLTATPDRTDKKAMGQIFEEVAYAYDIRDGIDEGWLVPIEQQSVFVEGLDFSSVKTTAGDLNGKDLAAVLEFEEILHGIADPTVQMTGDKKTLIFAASVVHAERLTEIINRHKPDSARFVCGTTPKEIRRGMFKDFAEKAFQYLVNVGVATEGFDDPGIECVVMARPTKSRTLYAQMAGRGTRPLPGIVDLYPGVVERREAIAASSKKCVAEGTLVLTDRGKIPIENVKITDLVWDGLTFVSHGGSVFSGVKEVVSYAGLTATPEHEVYIYDKASPEALSKTRCTFGECAVKQIPIAVTGISGKAIRKSEGYYRRNSSVETEQGTSIGRMPFLWSSNVEGNDKCVSQSCWLQEMRTSKTCSTLACTPMQSCEASMHQFEQYGLEIIRRKGYKVSIRISTFDGNVDSEKPWTPPESYIGQNQQQWSLRGRKSSLGFKENSKFQYEKTKIKCKNARIQIGSSRDSLCRFNFEKTNRPIFRNRNHKSFPYQIGQTKRRVWDIINAGPHHRFTANGLLISNCIEIFDFVGNAGRHKLVTSADILGGRYTDEVVELAKKNAEDDSNKNKKPVDIVTELQKAEREIAKRHREQEDAIARDHLLLRAKYSTAKVNPFNVLDIDPKREAPWHKGRGPTPGQTKYLEKCGVAIDGLTFTHASQIIDTMIKRREQGVCTFKQAKCLQKAGFDATEMTFKKAGFLIRALAKVGWQKWRLPKNLQPQSK